MRTHSWIPASALAAFVVTSPSVALSQPASDGVTEPAASQNVERGRRHFLRGVDFYKEGNFAAALVEFRRANQLAPNYRLLFNLGQTHFELHDYVNALHSFEEYLELGGEELRPARRAEVEEEIRTLRGRVAALTIRSNLAGSELVIDDAPSGSLPLSGPVLISAGRHTLSVRKNGAVQASRIVEVSGGDSATVELSAKAPEPAPPLPSTEPIARVVARSSRMSTAFWVSLTCASAFAVGTATAGILALDAQDDLERRLSAYPGWLADIDNARTKVKRTALIADILGGAAIAATALTVAFALWEPVDAEGTSRSGLVARIGPGGLVLEHRF